MLTWEAHCLVCSQSLFRTSGLPFLFVGGTLLPENFTAESTRWLQQALLLFPFALLGAVVSHRYSMIESPSRVSKCPTESPGLQACYNAGAQFMEPLEGVVVHQPVGICWQLETDGRYQHDLDNPKRCQMATTKERWWSTVVPRRCRPSFIGMCTICHLCFAKDLMRLTMYNIV